MRMKKHRVLILALVITAIATILCLHQKIEAGNTLWAITEPRQPEFNTDDCCIPITIAGVGPHSSIDIGVRDGDGQDIKSDIVVDYDPRSRRICGYINYCTPPNFKVGDGIQIVIRDNSGNKQSIWIYPNHACDCDCQKPNLKAPILWGNTEQPQMLPMPKLLIPQPNSGM